MLRILKNGGLVALLLDQNTQLNEGGVFVDFFGVPATVSAAGASLAYRTGTGIAFGFSIPDANGCYHIHLPPVINPPPYRRENADQATLELTRQITRVYEDMIRAHPECWLWMYKRWKHIRPGDSRERYPFYSSELRADLIPPSYGTVKHDD
jgi:Kdo2-lipid IVA lauroyltransferase/acyltransferase